MFIDLFFIELLDIQSGIALQLSISNDCIPKKTPHLTHFLLYEHIIFLFICSNL